jgi:hypothetical protein
MAYENESNPRHEGNRTEWQPHHRQGTSGNREWRYSQPDCEPRWRPWERNQPEWDCAPREWERNREECEPDRWRWGRAPSLCDLKTGMVQSFFECGPPAKLHSLKTAVLELAFGTPVVCDEPPRRRHDCEEQEREDCGEERCEKCCRSLRHCRCAHEEKCQGTSDIRIEARMDEVRETVILVENNSPRPIVVTLEADTWMNVWGAQVEGTITFTPPTLTLASCESLESKARMEVKSPLDGGNVYFTRIHLKGSCARPISVELNVKAQTSIDYWAKCDPCRRSCGHYVEVCNECCDDPRCEKCHPRREECGPRHEHEPRHRRDPWYAAESRWYRPWVPWWQPSYRCRRFLLPAVFGARCC